MPRYGGPHATVARSLIVALLVLGLAGAAWADEDEDSEDDSDRETVEIPYEVEITGPEEKKITTLLEQVSQLVALQERPPATIAALQRRADGDLERFRAALRSEGFYGSEIDISLDEAAEPVKITAKVTPGELYLLSDYVIQYVGAAEPEGEVPRQLEDLDLELGQAARAPEIGAADKQLLLRLAEQGYPLAVIADRRIVVDHALMSMAVVLQVDAGPLAAFGPVTISGLDKVEEGYVRRILPWKQGDRYDQREVDEARLRLSETRLFQSTVFEHAQDLDENGELPITLELAEGPRRAIAAGVTVSTDEGIGGAASWEHRNIFGANESVRLAARVAEIEQLARADFRKPRFQRPDQALLAGTGFRRSDNDAFKELTISGLVGLERTFGTMRRASGRRSPIWRGELSLLTEVSRIDDNDTDRNFTIFGLPLTATRDVSDDALNPARGTRLSLSFTPFVTTGDIDLFFTRADLGGSVYFSLHPEDRVIFASRARFGSILGARTDKIPATKRLYAGGGSSVRGFTFQKVGPLDEDNDPLGGRSVLELSGELRFRVFEDFGFVTFLDSGTVSDEPFLKFEERYLVAAGLGLRYFTGVGPLRFDIGFPVNPRDNDDSFQIYVSLGQAF